MSEVPGIAAPGADATPAPAQAPAPAPAATPTPAPAPAADAIKPGSTPDASQQTEDDEWEAATQEVFPGLKSANKDGKKDEPTKPEEKPETTPEAKETPETKKPDAQPGASDDTGEQGQGDKEDGSKPGDANDPAAAERAARAAARNAAQQVEAVKSDIRSKMFADVPKTLVDADGDPINGIDDVMKLINPRTNELFTEEEAGMWLLHAQQQFNQKIADIDKTIDQIADLQLDLKDQADSVNAKYGEWLKANPEERDKIWLAYEKTTVKDPNTGIIIHAPVGLEWFYEQTLGPRVSTAQAEAEKAAAEKAAQEKAEAEAKEKAEKERKQRRADRSDIFGPGQPDTRDDEDKEWDEAAEAYYGKKIK